MAAAELSRGLVAIKAGMLCSEECANQFWITARGGRKGWKWQTRLPEGKEERTTIEVEGHEAVLPPHDLTETICRGETSLGFSPGRVPGGPSDRG